MMRINNIVIDTSRCLTPLCELATEAATDKSPYNLNSSHQHRHGYTAIYDFLFSPQRFGELNVAEIGVLENRSIHAWRAFFPSAQIWGFDFDEAVIERAVADGLPSVHYGKMDIKDQRSIFNALNSCRVRFDIIIEDSTHLFDDQIRAIFESVRFLRPGGVLVIEDVFRQADEQHYREALEPIYKYFSSGFFVESDHEYNWTPGSVAPYFDNSKLLVLFRNVEPIGAQKKLTERSRDLISSSFVRGRLEARTINPPDITAPEYESGVEGLDRFYVVCHTAPSKELPAMFCPIYCGAAARAAPEQALTDILPDGTRLENRRWSELSAMYKIWRSGPRSRTVGFSHYRRYLSYNKDHVEPQVQIRLSEHPPSDFRDDELIALVGDSLILASRPRTFDRSVRDYYVEWHTQGDYDLVAEILSRTDRAISEKFRQQSTRCELFACNLFHSSWSHFDELCNLWFRVLGEFSARVQWPRGTTYENRDVSFLSERIFDAWLRFKIDQGVHVKELSTLFVADFPAQTGGRQSLR